ncbi:recombinase family protein [Clostridium sp.]|uniref:recombinase family protein n=1 Tax=Clostridium sp. TaxID=1506 RepID=UPI00283C0908|nr:recombinase family protein [Clostridium sp.]MDR3598778.1 recombinase family protein [Clostridium sp.]
MKTAILYCRVSTETQATQGVSILNQQQLLKNYANQNGYTEIIEIADEGFSGKNTNRPGFTQMLDLVKQKKVNSVIVYSLSRFARNTMDTLRTIEVLTKYNVTFISLSEKIETDTAVGKFFISVLASLSELERNQISERTKSALMYKKSKNELIGQVSFGYDCFDGKNLTENLEEQNTLRLMKQLRERKFSYSGIANHLTENGLKNKKGECKWYKSQIIRFLSREI